MTEVFKPWFWVEFVCPSPLSEGELIEESTSRPFEYQGLFCCVLCRSFPTLQLFLGTVPELIVQSTMLSSFLLPTMKRFSSNLHRVTKPVGLSAPCAYMCVSVYVCVYI